MSCAELAPYFQALGSLIVLGVLLEAGHAIGRGAVEMAAGAPPIRIGNVVALLFGIALLTGAVPAMLDLVGWGCGPAAPAAGPMDLISRLGEGLLRLMAVLLLTAGALALLLAAGRAVAAFAAGSGPAWADVLSALGAALLLLSSGALLHGIAGWLVRVVRAFLAGL